MEWMYDMPTFLVQVSVNIPYPKQFDYRETATSIGTAINRAIRKFRKEVKGKRIKQVNVKAIRL